MDFGIFSHGFRPHTTAAQTYEEDIHEIVLADKLGFRDAWISEHHGEPLYMNRVDTLPVPELMMCKASALTTRIRMGAAVNVIHLQHPVDTAIRAATTDHIVGDGRFMFGFGSGFSNPMFTDERGLTYEDRHPRMMEALELILRCWESEEPFDWNGTHRKGKGITALPKPFRKPHMPIATASETDATLRMAAERGYGLLTAMLETPRGIRRKTDIYARAALAAGRSLPLNSVSSARIIYIADSHREAVEDIREGASHEIGFQRERGMLHAMSKMLKLGKSADELTFDFFVESGVYVIGDPDSVAKQLRTFYDECGGFGTLLVITGKSWATQEKRARSLTRFMQEVAPQLRGLEPTPMPVAA